VDPAGVVGFVKDTAGEAVIGAKVYLVPNTDIPTAAIDLSTIANARASAVDEPLEDTIQANGAGYAQATTDANGIYRIATVPAGGRFYLTVIPAAADDAHLPGGSLCRASLQDTALVGKQLDVKVSTKPSAAAQFVGPSVCVNCHGVVHEAKTLHMNGIKPITADAPERFPDWFKARDQKFTAAGTTLYFVWDAGKSDSKIYETADKSADPALIHTARLYSAGGAFFVELKKWVAGVSTQWPGDGVSGAGVYKVELSYGGGLYKQRYITKIGDSRYVLPIQYNTDAADGKSGTSEDAAVPFGRWVWTQYNLAHWGASAANGGTPATPSATRSFDHMCAGCHFTGYELDTVRVKASGVPDANGDYDYDGDGQLESMNISCETCHGPGSEHWYRAGNGRSIVSPSLLTPEREVNICAQCHTRFKGMAVTTTGGPTLSGSEAGLKLSGTIAVTPRAGEKRSAFLENHVSAIDDGYWTVATGGDADHSVKHHQQVTDFIKSVKYRNPFELVTCATCHDLHGNSGLPHQLQSTLDASGANYTLAGAEGLCLSCHKPFLNGFPAPAGLTVGQRMQQHWAAQGVADTAMGNIECVDCHMPKTAKSGSGMLQAVIAGVQYWSGDISSHRFDVPLKAELRTAGVVGTIQMPLPYTNQCGGCHGTAP
jgi:hypothetical protein